MPMDSKQKLEYIVTHYIRLMYAEANGILRDPYEAEDACQETFVKLGRVLDRIEDVTTGSARSYVVTAVRNTAYDFIRKNRRQIPTDLVCDDAYLSAVFDCYPSDAADMVEDIEELPEIYRNIVRMRCLEEKSAVQIARELNTSVGTINSRLFRARDLLKKKWFGPETVSCGA